MVPRRVDRCAGANGGRVRKCVWVVRRRHLQRGLQAAPGVAAGTGAGAGATHPPAVTVANTTAATIAITAIAIIGTRPCPRRTHPRLRRIAVISAHVLCIHHPQRHC